MLAKLSAVLAVACIAGVPAVGAAGEVAWPTHPSACGESFASCVFAGLEPVSVETYQALQRRDAEILRGLPRKDLLRIDPPRVRTVLDAIVEAGWGSMDLFAHPVFARDPRVLYFDRDTLLVLDREYVVPVVFAVQGQLRETVADVPEGTEFVMEGFLLGNGRLAALYPHPVEIHRDDPPFDLFSGNYGFFTVNFADIVARDPNRLLLDEFRGRDRPSDRFGAIRAPLGCELEAFELKRDDEDVRVDIHCWPWAPDWWVRHPLFDRR